MKTLADVQSSDSSIRIPINRVGVKGLRFPLRLRDRACGIQTVSAMASLGVDLAASKRGTHMSRFVEILSDWQEELGCQSVRNLLEKLRVRLESQRAWADFEFSYLMQKTAPASGGTATISYECSVSAELAETLAFTLAIQVPVMTVCPCSQAISCIGAHSQRALIRMKILIERFVWLEDLILIAESAGSSPVYPLLKREDEKFVTEAAFANPAFVEDVARRVASGLEKHPQTLAFEVEVESMESIHNHNAFAYMANGKCR